MDQILEKGQTFFALKGTGFRPADQVVEVVAVEVPVVELRADEAKEE